MQSIFSTLSKVNPFSRKEIFSDYRLPEDPTTNEQRVPVSKDKRKNDQILIKQLRMFKFNLSSVLDEKNELVRRMNDFEYKIDQDDNPEIKRKFDELCRQDEPSRLMNYIERWVEENFEGKKSAQPLYFLKSMILYRSMLNSGKQLKYETQNFRLGTMSNFNQITTKANFTKTPQSAEETIRIYIQNILAQSAKAMESKIRENNNWQNMRFLREDDKSKASWKELEHLYNPKQVELVHFEMLNVLNQFDQVVQQFSNLISSHQTKYKKYQGVMDSIQLMSRQMREMQHVIEMKHELLTTLSQKSTSQPYHSSNTLELLVEREKTQQNSIEKNIKIYHINQKLFANYNTETNLISYYKLRKEYSKKLADFQKRIIVWNEELKSLKEIAGLYGQIDNLAKRKTVSGEGKGKLSSKKYLTSVSTLDSEIGILVANLEETNARKSPQLHSFKRNLLDELKNRLSKDAPNLKMTVYPSQSSETSKDSQILERQLSFFRILQQTPTNSKKDHLIKNINLIEEFIVFNQKIKKTNNERVIRYLWQFQLCQMIALMAQGFKQVQSGKNGSEGFPKTIKSVLQHLQKVFKQSDFRDDSHIHELFSNHINDYEIMKKLFQSKIWQEYVLDLENIKDKGRQIGMSFSFSNDSKQKIQKLNQLISFTEKTVSMHYLKPVQNILTIFYESLFQINLEMSFELCAFEHYFWQTLCGSVAEVYKQTNYTFTEDIKSLRSLDPDDFFSVPCLTLMIKNKIKIKNLQEIILKVLKKHYNKLGNFDPQNLLVSIVNLTLLITYLSCAKYQTEDTEDKIKVLNKLRRYMTVQLLKFRYDKVYLNTIKENNTLPLKEIRMILGVENYLTIKDPSEKLYSQLQFNQNCQKYLDMLEKQIKPLTINISPSFSSERTVNKLWNLYFFEQWLSLFESIICDTKISPMHQFSSMSILRSRLQEITKLVESPFADGIKESSGFLIKRIKKENFYIKRQISKFKILGNEGIWQDLEKMLTESITNVQQGSQVNDRVGKLQALRDLESRAKKALMRAEKRN